MPPHKDRNWTVAITGILIVAAAGIAGLLHTASRTHDPRSSDALPDVHAHQADELYATALQSFEASRDWSRLRDDVARLAASCGDEWKMRPAISGLLDRLEARIRWLPQARAEGLKDGRPTLAHDLSEVPWSDYAANRLPFWLLPPVRQRAVCPLEDRLREAGAEAIPVLIALLDDEMLTPTIGQNGDGYWQGTPDPRDPWQTEVVFRPLMSPITRGQLARELLKQVLPSEEDKGMGSTVVSCPAVDDPTAVRDLPTRSEALYRQLHGKQTLDVVRFYLAHQYEPARKQMLRALLEYPDLPRFAADVEAALLELEPSWMHHEYLVRQGDAVRPFAERLLVRTQERRLALERTTQSNKPLGQPIQKPSGNGLGESGRHPDMERSLHAAEALRVVVEEFLAGRTWQKSLMDLREGMSPRDLPRSFWLNLRAVPLAESVPAILEAAVSADSPRSASELLVVLSLLRQRRQYACELRGAAIEPEVYDPAPVRHQWERLLRDERHTVAIGRYGSSQWRMSSLAFGALWDLCAGECTVLGFDNGMALPRNRIDLALIQAGLAILDGKRGEELKHLFDEEPSAERVRAVSDRIARTGNPELRLFLSNLTNVDYLAVMQLAREDSGVRSRLVPLASRLERIEGSLPIGFPLGVGETMSVERVKKLAEFLTEKCQDLSLEIHCERMAGEDGFSVVVESIPTTARRDYGAVPLRQGATPQAVVRAVILTSEKGLVASTQWLTGTEFGLGLRGQNADGCTVASSSVDADAFPDKGSMVFWKAVESVLEDGSSNPMVPVQIRLWILQPMDVGNGQMIDEIWFI